MPNIYKHNDEFSLNNVIDNINNIAEELDEEQNKPLEERDKRKEQKLIWKQFYEGLKLSTGYKFFK